MSNWEKDGLINAVGDEKIGVDLFIKSLSAPLRTILENAGISPDIIISKLMSDPDKTYKAYDVLKDEYLDDAYSAGLIDPASVVISEVENAASIAGLLLTSTAAIVDIPDKNEQQPPMAPPMM